MLFRASLAGPGPAAAAGDNHAELAAAREGWAGRFMQRVDDFDAGTMTARKRQ